MDYVKGNSMNNSDMPAMPHPEEGYHDNPKQGTGFNVFTGLTKREHFAAMAMQGMITAEWHDHTMPKRAVYFADRLLEALEEE